MKLYLKTNPNAMTGKKRQDNAKRNKERVGWCEITDETRKLMSDKRRENNHLYCKVKDEDIDDIIKMREDGISAKRISLEYNVSVGSIYRILRGERKKSIKNV